LFTSSKQLISSSCRCVSNVVCEGKSSASLTLSNSKSCLKEYSLALNRFIEVFTVLREIPSVLPILRLLYSLRCSVIICFRSIGSSVFAISHLILRQDTC